MKKIGDLITYSDEILLNYKGIGMVAMNNNQDKKIPTSKILYLTTSPILMSEKEYNKYEISMEDQDMLDIENIENSFSMRFKFESLMNAWYCDQGKCKTVPSEKIVPASFPENSNWNKIPPPYVLASGTYEGKPVFNHSGCWGMCDAVKDGKDDKKNVVTLSGNQYVPSDYLTDNPPAPLWKQTHNKNMRNEA